MFCITTAEGKRSECSGISLSLNMPSMRYTNYAFLNGFCVQDVRCSNDRQLPGSGGAERRREH